jgi:transcriptional regulator with XRE-family HTH domain
MTWKVLVSDVTSVRLVADVIRASRVSRALTQAELARRVGVSVMSISRVERGRRVRVRTGRRIARALGVPLRALLLRSDVADSADGQVAAVLHAAMSAVGERRTT